MLTILKPVPGYTSISMLWTNNKEMPLYIKSVNNAYMYVFTVTPGGDAIGWDTYGHGAVRKGYTPLYKQIEEEEFQKKVRAILER